MNLNFPQFALFCIEKIEEQGFEAWFVGGCVRDALLNREFYDIDIATNAMPDDIIKIFEKTIPTGIKHGTVTVILDGNSIEVTTFRTEFDYTDSRHPGFVVFKSEITDDLSRRDFTINALAYHPKMQLLDAFGGVLDLNHHLIRCVNNPYNRFEEDALRILRAFRFACQLDFEIENETEKAAISLSKSLNLLSGERVFSEVKKVICSKNLSPFNKLIKTGCLEFFGINSPKEDLSVLNNLRNELDFRLPIFLNLCNFNQELLKDKLKIDNESLKTALTIRKIINSSTPKTKTDIKLLLSKYGTSVFEIYLEYLSIFKGDIQDLRSIFSDIIKNNEPYSLSQLAVCGEDIKALGFKGAEIGERLDLLLNKVIAEPGLNKKEVLISILKN